MLILEGQWLGMTPHTVTNVSGVSTFGFVDDSCRRDVIHFLLTNQLDLVVLGTLFVLPFDIVIIGVRLRLKSDKTSVIFLSNMKTLRNRNKLHQYPAIYFSFRMILLAQIKHINSS